MAIDAKIRKRISELIDHSSSLSVGDQNGQCTSPSQQAECSAWITSAINCLHLVFPSALAPYRAKADLISLTSYGFLINDRVRELAAVLRGLLYDTDAGLITTLVNQVRAETFDDFLDHADAYVKQGRKNEAGVIAGVVFEDTIRRICDLVRISQKGQKLDGLISLLATTEELSGAKAKRARAAAHVRTKASHAQWDEFEENDVVATISFCRELIEAKLA